MKLTEARSLAIELMEKHGLRTKENYWRFDFDGAKVRFGVCNVSRRYIRLSRALVILNDLEHVRDTILHEIAHALTPGAGHNWKWRQQAIAIGCDGNRTYNGNVVKPAAGRWKAVCATCGQETFKHRAPRIFRSTACGTCCKKYNYGRYSEKYKLTFNKI